MIEKILQLGEAHGNRVGKTRLFALDDLGDARGGLAEFGIGSDHLLHDGIDHFVEEWLRLAEQASVADRAANDFAQHIAAAFVGGKDAVADEEGGGAAVVGDDAQRGGAGATSPSLELLLLADRRPVNSAARSMSGTNRSVS